MAEVTSFLERVAQSPWWVSVAGVLSIVLAIVFFKGLAPEKPKDEHPAPVPPASSSNSTTGNNSTVVQTGDHSPVTINQSPIPTKNPLVEISYGWIPSQLPLAIHPKDEIPAIVIRNDWTLEATIITGAGNKEYLWPKGEPSPGRGAGIIRFTNQGDVSVFNVTIKILVKKIPLNSSENANGREIALPPINVTLGGPEAIVYVINDTDDSGQLFFSTQGEGRIQGNSTIRPIPLEYRNRNGLPLPLNFIMPKSFGILPVTPKTSP